MERSPMLAAILAAAVITLASAGTAGAQELCGAPVDENGSSGDVTCGPAEQATESGDHGMTPAGQSGTDEPAAKQNDQQGSDQQGSADHAGSGDAVQKDETARVMRPSASPQAQVIVDDMTDQLPDADAAD